jgi:hypothetical protein
MSQRCPHCDATLPWVADAYCSSCGNRLDEPPSPVTGSAANPPPAAPPGGPSRAGGPLGLVAMLAGVLALFPAALAVTRGSWPDAIYTGGVGVALVISGAVLHGRAGRSG